MAFIGQVRACVRACIRLLHVATVCGYWHVLGNVMWYGTRVILDETTAHVVCVTSC